MHTHTHIYIVKGEFTGIQLNGLIRGKIALAEIVVLKRLLPVQVEAFPNV